MWLEFVKITIAFILFVIPGKIITDLLIPKHLKNDFLKKMFFYFVTSCAFATILGLLFGKLSMMNQFTIQIVYVVFLSLFLIEVFLIYDKNSLKWRLKIDKGYLRTLIPLIAFSIFFLCYFVYQDQSFPRGGDGSLHYIRIIQLLNLGNTPSTELGVMVMPYYQRGYHFLLTIFTLLSSMDVIVALKLFNAIIFSFLAIAIYTFTDVFFRNKESAIFSSFAFLFVGKLFLVQGSYPMILTLLYIGILLVICQYISETKKFDVKYLPYSWLVLTSLIVSHLVSMQIFLFFFLGIVIFNLIYKSESSKVHIKSIVFLFIVLFLALVYYYITQRNLFIGQLNFLLLRSTIFNAPNDFMHALTFRTAVKEFLALFITPYLIPLFICGLVIAFEKQKTSVIAIASVAVTFLFTQILPLNGREPYILFYPFLSAVGVGMEQTLTKLRKNFKDFMILPLVFMAILLIFSITQLVYVASFPHIGQSVFLSEYDIEFCKLLNDKEIKNETIASLGNPSALLIEAMTYNNVLIGESRWYDIQSFQDIYKIFSPNTTFNDIKMLIQKYNITSIFIKEGWINTNDLTQKITQGYSDCEIISYKDSKLILLNTISNARDDKNEKQKF